MIYDDDLREFMTREVLKALPKIDGVSWDVKMCHKVDCPIPTIITKVSAIFETHNIALPEAVSKIYDKVHQITSNGQIKLELE